MNLFYSGPGPFISSKCLIDSFYLIQYWKAKTIVSIKYCKYLFNFFVSYFS